MGGNIRNQVRQEKEDDNKKGNVKNSRVVRFCQTGGSGEADQGVQIFKGDGIQFLHQLRMQAQRMKRKLHLDEMRRQQEVTSININLNQYRLNIHLTRHCILVYSFPPSCSRLSSSHPYSLFLFSIILISSLLLVLISRPCDLRDLLRCILIINIRS